MGWKRIAKDARSCYFQASQLVKFTNKVVSSYLIQGFFSRPCESYEVMMMVDETGDVLCSMVIDFQVFLSQSLESTDEHLMLIVNFLLVSGEFLEFVLSYRSQDSIIVESVYKRFAPIWKVLGQVKYLEAT